MRDCSSPNEMPRHADDITTLLQFINKGSENAWENLIQRCYSNLHSIAHRIRYEAGDSPPTLDTYAILNEAFDSIYHSKQIEWKDRKHFYLTMAQAFRFEINRYKRLKNTIKRGMKAKLVPFDEVKQEIEELSFSQYNVVDSYLEEALGLLAEKQPRSFEWIVLRFFMGLTEKEIAELYDVSRRTVIRDWVAARHFLAYYLQK